VLKSAQCAGRGSEAGVHLISDPTQIILRQTVTNKHAQ